MIPRETAARLGRQAVEIIRTGRYVTADQKVHEIGDQISYARNNTVSYPPDKSLPEMHTGNCKTKIDVINETTLTGARRLLDRGLDTVILNFASGTHPGGGFLSGARAQEEYLARSSALYACLEGNAMYEYHREKGDPAASDYVLYSPGVPVFRDDSGNLLNQPYTVAMITSPAVNRTYAYHLSDEDIEKLMWSRILKVLSIGLHHGHDGIVLGAWGCGAFNNDPWQIARLFHRAIHDNFRGSWRKIIFAIVDFFVDKMFIGPFEKVFS